MGPGAAIAHASIDPSVMVDPAVDRLGADMTHPFAERPR